MGIECVTADVGEIHKAVGGIGYLIGVLKREEL